MNKYKTTKKGYNQLREALNIASENPGEIPVDDMFVQGTVGVVSPVYHIANSTVRVAPRDEGLGFEVSAASDFTEREAVSALEHLPWLYELTDRKIKLTRIKE